MTEKKAEPKKTIGATAKAAIREGKTNEQVLEIVRKEFPGSNTTLTSINWYRNRMRQEDETLKGSTKPIPTSREQKAAAKPKAEPKAPKAAKKSKEAPKDPLS
jgi:hypothetical protein